MSEDVVKVRMSRDLVEQFWARPADGARVTVDWGEPDAEGFHEPVFTRHDDDRLVPAAALAEREETIRLLRARVALLRARVALVERREVAALAEREALDVRVSDALAGIVDGSGMYTRGYLTGRADALAEREALDVRYVVDRCRQRLAGAGADIITLRLATEDADRIAAIDRLKAHLDEIDRILTAALAETPEAAMTESYAGGKDGSEAAPR